MLKKIIVTFLVFIINASLLFAQEFEKALNDNAFLNNYKRPTSAHLARTELTLPFFEDFTDTAYYPNIAHWSDSLVYINNNLGKNVFSKGVATFDALNAKGFPYNSNSFLSVYSDSLTSQYFNLNAYNPSDSIYLSFKYQRKGNGFAPAVGDSLMLFFQKRNGTWIKVWEKEGGSDNDFKNAIIPLKDTSFLHPDFRFRWVNLAKLGIGNAHWNIDYVVFDKNRNFQDTSFNDLAFTYWGVNDQNKSLVNEYTAMPYNHFNAKRTLLFNKFIGVSLRNNWLSSQNLNLHITATNAQTGLAQTESFNGNINSNTNNSTIFQNFQDNLINVSNAQSPLHIDFNCYFDAINNDYSNQNDTISFKQIFDNYFAYDDGSAEGAYYLSSYQGVPSYVAQEYMLNVKDTVRGVQIYFPRQAPDASFKEFYLQIYKKIDAVGGQNEMVYQQIDLLPNYSNRVNGFVTYQFQNDVILDSGIFYVALMFPAGGFSDSLYIGLDKNKIGANYRYFKVDNHWQPSLIDGALMIRPLVGKALPLNISNVKKELSVSIYPNPVSKILEIKYDQFLPINYVIYDYLGKTVKTGKLTDNKIDCSSLNAGNYYILLSNKNGEQTIKKLIKIEE